MRTYDPEAVKPRFGTLVACKMKNGLRYINHHKWMDQISHLRHPNLVMPIAYCFGTNRMIFVFEFVNNGSLDEYLFTENYGRHEQLLSWATRIKVAVGVAGVLAFLHSLEKPLILGVIETADILLDRVRRAIFSFPL